MKRSFLNNDRFPTIEAKSYHQGNDDKPTGLWYEVNDAWKNWVVDNAPDWMGERFNHEHHIVVDMTNVLVIRTAEEMMEFTRKYVILQDGYFRTFHIDWTKVAEDYDGIEIPEYLWSFRMNDDTRWYYTWDVASGCIWNTDIITIIKSNPLDGVWHEACRYQDEW